MLSDAGSVSVSLNFGASSKPSSTSSTERRGAKLQEESLDILFFRMLHGQWSELKGINGNRFQESPRFGVSLQGRMHFNG